jgi:predicted RNA-binding Zn-ribbon protein involved in translation (DUF1610 family)
VKNSKKCTKCGAVEIVRIPGRVGAYGAGNNIPVGWLDAIKVTRFLCANCGFSEEWIEEAEDLAELRRRYNE